MGMFDYVRSEVPMPDGWVGEMQSKDFDCEMTEIVIRADGRLVIERFEYEAVPLEERPYPNEPDGSLRRLIGSVRRVNRRWEDLNYHGDFNFYGDEQVGPRIFVPAHEGATWGHYKSETRWHEYTAHFTDGELVGIISATPS